MQFLQEILDEPCANDQFPLRFEGGIKIVSACDYNLAASVKTDVLSCLNITKEFLLIYRPQEVIFRFANSIRDRFQIRHTGHTGYDLKGVA